MPTSGGVELPSGHFGSSRPPAKPRYVGSASNSDGILCAGANGGQCQEQSSGRSYLTGPNNSTFSNGFAPQGRKRFSVNFVFCPGATSTRR